MNVGIAGRKWDGLFKFKSYRWSLWAAEERCLWGKKDRKGRMNTCMPRRPLAPHAGQTPHSLRVGHSRAVRKLQHHLLDSKYVWSCHEPDVALPGEGQSLYIFPATTWPEGNTWCKGSSSFWPTPLLWMVGGSGLHSGLDLEAQKLKSL